MSLLFCVPLPLPYPKENQHAIHREIKNIRRPGKALHCKLLGFSSASFTLSLHLSLAQRECTHTNPIQSEPDLFSFPYSCRESSYICPGMSLAPQCERFTFVHC